MTSVANIACSANIAYQNAATFSGEENRRNKTTWPGRTLQLCGAASRALLRWSQGAPSRYALNQLSDRALADIGLDHGNLAAHINARLDSLRGAKRQEARIRRELMAYTDAELDDINVKRADIPAIARGEYPFEVEVSNPVTSVVRPAPAANDQHQIAAA